MSKVNWVALATIAACTGATAGAPGAPFVPRVEISNDGRIPFFYGIPYPSLRDVDTNGSGGVVWALGNGEIWGTLTDSGPPSFLAPTEDQIPFDVARICVLPQVALLDAGLLFYVSDCLSGPGFARGLLLDGDAVWLGGDTIGVDGTEYTLLDVFSSVAGASLSNYSTVFDAVATDDPLDERRIFTIGGEARAWTGLTVPVGGVEREIVSLGRGPIGSGSNRVHYNPSESGDAYFVLGTLDVEGDEVDALLDADGVAQMADGGAILEGATLGESAGGLADEVWDDLRQPGEIRVFDNGRWFASGRTWNPTGNSDVLVRDGRVVQRRADVLLTALGGVRLNSLAAADMNSSGDVVALWSGRKTSDQGPTLRILIINGVVRLVTGDLVDLTNDGVIDGADEGAVFGGSTFPSDLAVVTERRVDGSFDVVFTGILDGVGPGHDLVGLRMTVPAFEDPEPCDADTDMSGTVDLPDLLALLASFGGVGGSDLDGTGTVDLADLVFSLSAFGTTCP